MKYGKPGAIRKLASSKLKRVSPSFLLYLDIRIEGIIDEHCKALGAVKKTLNMEDAEAFDAFFKRKK